MSDIGIQRSQGLVPGGLAPDITSWDAPHAVSRAWRRGGSFAVTVLLGLSLPAVLVLIWSVAVRQEWLAPQILPAPSLVWQTGLELATSGQLAHELAVSLARVMTGVLLGGLAGLAVGVAFGLSRTLETYAAPTIRAFFLVPSLGWLPFFMLVLGIGETLKIVLIAKTAFLPLMVGVFEAIRSMPAKYDDVARALELDRRARLRHIVLPAVLPAIATGFRLSLSKGWKALILVEMLASAAGIGYLMMWGRKSFQLDVVFATMIVIGLVGWALDHGLLKLQNRTTRWSFHSVR
ncbi:ABC transporter permease [Ancylobacter sp. Lp-2]|uniref:ABC transporter permease n=1 Tax=Ancylobacter sp. Lp-2 TaxID=2881339 RepID=UPI001E585115|nr:ABC transporter permease [Ancylobacter sp. Lp-2]MCB4771223.1 ABC transporter permease [Ancylobacter sp. Lp-2]